MTVSIPVPMTSEEQAAVQGVSVDDLLHKAVLQIISTSREVVPQDSMSMEEWNRAFEEMADMILENVPEIPDEALSRESIYTRSSVRPPATKR